MTGPIQERSADSLVRANSAFDTNTRGSGRPHLFSVARVSNMLYRRFSASAARQSAAAAQRRPIGSALYASRAPQGGRLAGWKHCDTAGWKPALRAGGPTLNTYG